jgi:hypothetical protein
MLGIFQGNARPSKIQLKSEPYLDPRGKPHSSRSTSSSASV